MHIALEILITLLKVVKSLLVSIVFALLPAPKKSVDGEIVLITGGGSGIGQVMCVEFAKRGATIVSWDVSASGNSKTEGLVRSAGGTVHTYICDVSKREDVRQVAKQVRQEVGDVDILINNAGVVNGTPFVETSDEALARCVNINLMAHFWTLKCFLPSMIRRNHGHVVTIASMAGIIPVNRLADYCATKYANVGFTESLSYELTAAGADKVHTTIICPYTISTGLFEGVQERFPSLMPTLTTDYAANRIVKAVLTNQKILFMPRAMYILGALKNIIPVETSETLQKFFGGLTFMANFTGRFKKE